MTFQKQSRFQLLGSQLLKYALVICGALALIAPAAASKSVESWYSKLTWSAYTLENKTTFGPDLTSFIAKSQPVALSGADSTDSEINLEVAYFPAFSCAARVGLTFNGGIDDALHEQILAAEMPLNISIDSQVLAFPYLAETIENGSDITTIQVYMDADFELRSAAQILIELGNQLKVEVAGQSAELSLRGSRDTITQVKNRCETAATQ